MQATTNPMPTAKEVVGGEVGDAGAGVGVDGAGVGVDGAGVGVNGGGVGDAGVAAYVRFQIAGHRQYSMAGQTINRHLLLIKAPPQKKGIRK